MTDWAVVKPANGDAPALVKAERTYVLHPGEAHFYDVGDIHSPKRMAPTRLIRIEGQNLDDVKRGKFAVAA